MIKLDPEFDPCIVGGKDGRVIYSRELIIEVLCNRMDYTEALEDFDFNFAGAYFEGCPIFTK